MLTRKTFRTVAIRSLFVSGRLAVEILLWIFRLLRTGNNLLFWPSATNAASHSERVHCIKHAVQTQKHRRPKAPCVFCRSAWIRIMSAHAGGVCMSQCGHWRIPLFCFPGPHKGKQNASESPLEHEKRTGDDMSISSPVFAFFRFSCSPFRPAPRARRKRCSSRPADAGRGAPRPCARHCRRRGRGK